MDNTLTVMKQVMEHVGYDMSKNDSLVCIGHSVGGQVCRHYAKQLKSVMAGIFTIDSVPVP